MATSEIGSTRRIYDCKDNHGLGLNGLSEMMESPVFDDSKLIWACVKCWLVRKQHVL